MKKHFSYTRWAKAVAADILESDLGCGFDVAQSCPDPHKGRRAIEKLIFKLKRESQAKEA